MASGLTSASGTYVDCGFGEGYSLTVICQGPSCAALANFPNLFCTQPSALTSECDNGVTCSNVPPPTIESTNFASNFTVQQPPMGITTTTTQNIDVNGQGISLNGTSDGNVIYSYGAITVSNNGTSVSGTPVATGAQTTSSSAAKRRFCPPWFLLFIVFVTMFVGQVPAQSVSWNDVLQDIPNANVDFITQLEPQLCDGSVPVIDAVICGARQQVLGMADIVRLCLEVVGQAPQPAAATSDPVSAMLFTLGNTVACNKIANAMLSGTTDQQVGRDLCSAVIPSSACVTSIVTTLVTTHGSTMTISSFLSISSSPQSGSTTARTTGALPSAASNLESATAEVSASAVASSARATQSQSGPTRSQDSTPAGITLSTPAAAPTNGSLREIKHRRNGVICDDPDI